MKYICVSGRADKCVHLKFDIGEYSAAVVGKLHKQLFAFQGCNKCNRCCCITMAAASAMLPFGNSSSAKCVFALCNSLSFFCVHFAVVFAIASYSKLCC